MLVNASSIISKLGSNSINKRVGMWGKPLSRTSVRFVQCYLQSSLKARLSKGHTVPTCKRLQALKLIQ